MSPPTPASTAFVLVPGGMSPGYFFNKVAAQLTVSGYTAVSVDLPSVGDQGAFGPATLADDAAYVRGQASALLAQNKDVVLVGNGYGGIVITEAGKGLDADTQEGQGELLHLVYLASLLGSVGDSSFGLVSEQLSVNITPHGPDVAYIPTPPVAEAGAQLFSDLPVEEQLQYAGMLKPHSVAAMMGNLTYAAYEDLPTTVVIPTRDKAVDPEFQLRKLEEVVKKGVFRKGVRKVILEGDHMIMLSHPKEVTEVLIEAAAGKT